MTIVCTYSLNIQLSMNSQFIKNYFINQSHSKMQISKWQENVYVYNRSQIEDVCLIEYREVEEVIDLM